MFRTLATLAVGIVLALTGGCSPAGEARGPLVLAAASLQDGLDEAADAWTVKGHARPVLSFAASSALARQVESGAPADLFISADEEWMDALAAKGLIEPGTRADFLTNRLVLVAPAASKVALKAEPGFPLAAALGQGRLAMADPGAVPAGRYGKEALGKLGVWDSVASRIASAENVRAALAMVARGEAPLGVVYATDAKAEPGVRVVAVLPQDSHTPITYPLAILDASQHDDAAGFRDYLLSPEAQAIFRKHGFGAP